MVLLRAMAAPDLDAVLTLEGTLHRHPWTRGNFSDALTAGYFCRVAQDATTLAAYAIWLPGAGEAELLTLGVAPMAQRRGLGRRLLDDGWHWAQAAGMQRLLLEVRPSNAAALALYRQTGWRETGRRRGYYPAATGREDAILMEKTL